MTDDTTDRKRSDDRRAPRRTSVKPRGGRPTRAEAQAIEEQLRAAALEIFVADGFDGATMESIADAAGITKRTLYAKFPDKRELFIEVVPWALARSPFPDVEIDVFDDDLESALKSVADQVIARLVEPDAVKLRQLAVREAHRFPEFAAESNANLWVQTVQPVVGLLQTHAARGGVDIDDIDAAATLFFSLVAGGPTMLADLGVFPSEEWMHRHTEQAIALFLRGALPR